MLYLPPLWIGGVNLSGKVDVLPGLGSRLLLVTQVGHEQLRKSNMSCWQLSLRLGSDGQGMEQFNSLLKYCQ